MLNIPDDPRNRYALGVMAAEIVLIILSLAVLPDPFTTGMIRDTSVTIITTSKRQVIAMELVLSSCALWLYIKNGYLLRLLILAIAIDIFSAVLLFLNSGLF